MPLVDGVKMACAPCIRGHRSTSCQHTDRQLMEVRKKGRPMTQCNHCRELRKVRQVHIRCACKPDESEGPKRAVKGEKKRIDQEQDAPACNCDETGICTCATPRGIASSSRRKLSIPSTSDSSRRDQPSCPHSPACSSSPSDGAGCCSPSSPSCCTSPPTPPDPLGLPIGLEIPIHSPLPSLGGQAPEVQAPLQFDSSWLDFNVVPNTRSHRYTPYPQSSHSLSTSLGGGPSDPLTYSRLPLENTLTPPNSATLDAETALWDQFLRGDPLPEETAPTIGPNLDPNSSAPPSILPHCGCTPCALHGSLSACADPRNCDHTWDCSMLQAAISAIGLSLVTNGATAQTPIIDSNTNNLSMPNSSHLYVQSAPESLYTDGLNLGSMPASIPPPIPELPTNVQLNPVVQSTSVTLPTACCCGSTCSCFLCRGSDGHSSEGGDCRSCSTCDECQAINRTLDELQNQFTQPRPDPGAGDLGQV